MTAHSSGQGARAEVSFDVLLEALEVMRLAPIYALLHVAPDELAEGFKPHKWEGFEREFADKSVTAYRRLIAEMSAAEMNATCEGKP